MVFQVFHVVNVNLAPVDILLQHTPILTGFKSWLYGGHIDGAMK